MTDRLAVIVSKGQSRSPEKRKLEEEIAAQLAQDENFDVTVIAHLYDLRADGPAIEALRCLHGDFVFLSWMYPRGSHWVLDRFGICGHFGETELADVDDEEEEVAADAEDEDKLRVIEERELPDRTIYCMDLRVDEKAETFINEVRRIFHQRRGSGLTDWLQGSGSPDQMQHYLAPTNDTALPTNAEGEAPLPMAPSPLRIENNGGRRWYPVIDFSRCTNCMECVDFCLFGVYGVDHSETILVEQPDNCRKGCPACSRVCPENAIIFPQHKTPAIAGADVAMGGLKIDLSRLFGAPDDPKEAVDVAVRERDEQLLLAGRAAVGDAVGIPKRQSDKDARVADPLDQLIDQLDELDL